MDQELRSCWRCGMRTDCFVEPCSKGCPVPVCCACETCVAETEGLVLELQAGEHRCLAASLGSWFAPRVDKKPRKRYACGLCGREGHTKKKCEKKAQGARREPEESGSGPGALRLAPAPEGSV